MAKNPHEQGGLATPPPDLEDDETPADEPVDDEDEGDAGDDSAGEPQPRSAGRVTTRRAGRSSSVAQQGAGWVLGLVLWAGVGLPFLKGGPAGVGAWWRAKFLNQAPDGSELP